MNPFNKVWIVLVWLATAAGCLASINNEFRMAPLVLVFFALLITGQTIGADRAEREYEANLKTLQTPALTPPTLAMQEAAAKAMAQESAGYDWDKLSQGGKDRYHRILDAALDAMKATSRS